MEESEEKVLPGTERKREEARKRGQVARSADFTAAVALLAAMAMLRGIFPSAGAALVEYSRHMFDFHMMDPARLGESVSAMEWSGARAAAGLVLPVAVIAVVFGLCAGVGQVGFLIAPDTLTPRFERINPAEGIKRLFSRRSLFEFLKSILKMVIAGLTAFLVLRADWNSGALSGLMRLPLADSLHEIGGLIWKMGIWASAALIVLGTLDIVYQRYEYERSLRMSDSEFKRERKETDGNPEARAEIRRAQRVASQGQKSN